MIYFCCDDNRRSVLLGNPNLNGIDYLEVLDDPSAPAGQNQRTLFVTFVNDVTLSLGPGNMRGNASSNRRVPKARGEWPAGWRTALSSQIRPLSGLPPSVASFQVNPSRKLVPEPRVATQLSGRYPGRSAP